MLCCVAVSCVVPVGLYCVHELEVSYTLLRVNSQGAHTTGVTFCTLCYSYKERI